MIDRIWGRGLALTGSLPIERPAGFFYWRSPRWVSSCRVIDFPPGSPGIFISGAEMAKANEAAVAENVKDQDATAAVGPADQAIAGGDNAPATAAAVAAPVASDGAAGAVENPLDIISEIEHLVRIVGNIAVHEFRRITERLADLKNHPAIKPTE